MRIMFGSVAVSVPRDHESRILRRRFGNLEPASPDTGPEDYFRRPLERATVLVGND